LHCSHVEDLQVISYRKGQFYHFHHDGDNQPSFNEMHRRRHDFQ
jgi:hypothetical protein